MNKTDIGLNEAIKKYKLQKKSNKIKLSIKSHTNKYIIELNIQII